MLAPTTQTEKARAEKAQARTALLEQAIGWARQGWRPAGTAIAVLLALLLGWGVVSGRHGLSAWQQQRTEDKALKKEIQQLQQDNARLQGHIQRLKSDPDTIEREAREQLHYARPGEVIYKLPAQPQPQAPANNP